MTIHRWALFAIGYVWMILLPLKRLSRGTYIDENALQPGQVGLNHVYANFEERLIDHR
jgi:glycosylphosphatidylinositol transamidase